MTAERAKRKNFTFFQKNAEKVLTNGLMAVIILKR